MTTPRVGIVVPTIGDREIYLVQTLRSVKANPNVYVLLVHSPKYVPSEAVRELCDKAIVEEKQGLSSAINFGVEKLPESCVYVGWLGDDDLLIENTVVLLAERLDANPSLTFVYGGCTYIDAGGNTIGLNRSGTWAMRLSKFGPDLIPQPGSLFRRSSFEQVGGVSNSYKFAFDHDLFLNLLCIGPGAYLNLIVSAFRWHPSSLSVSQRRLAVKEASEIRLAHQHWIYRKFFMPWERLVRFLTLYAGTVVSFRVKLMK